MNPRPILNRRETSPNSPYPPDSSQRSLGGPGSKVPDDGHWSTSVRPTPGSRPTLRKSHVEGTRLTLRRPRLVVKPLLGPRRGTDTGTVWDQADR